MAAGRRSLGESVRIKFAHLEPTFSHPRGADAKSSSLHLIYAWSSLLYPSSPPENRICIIIQHIQGSDS